MHQSLLDHIFHERLIRISVSLETLGEPPEQELSQVRKGLGLDRSARPQVMYPARILTWGTHRHLAFSQAHSGLHSSMDASLETGLRGGGIGHRLTDLGAPIPLQVLRFAQFIRVCSGSKLVCRERRMPQ